MSGEYSEPVQQASQDGAGGGAALGQSRYEEVAALLQRRGSLVVLALVVLVASFSLDSFASLDNARGIAISQATDLALVALAMTFVILTGGIDLSVGSVFALGGVLSAAAAPHGTLAALLLPLAVCGGIGLVNGLLVVRARMAPFIVTLTTLLFARGLLLSLTSQGQNTRVFPAKLDLVRMSQGSWGGFGYPVFIALGFFALGTLLLQRTGFGQSVFAIGSNEDAARLMGLGVDRVKLLVYVQSGLLAGFAGTMSSARQGSGVTIQGVGLELTAISAVVIGGTLLTGGAGTTGGTLAGVVLLGVIANVINLIPGLKTSWQPVVNGGFLILVVVTQAYLARRQRL